MDDMQEKRRQEMERSYTDLITELKILYMRADYNKKEKDAMRYKSAYKKLELIQERRHLTPLGEKGGHRRVYELMLQMVKNRYKNNSIDTIEDTIREIESFCEKYEIKEKEKKDGIVPSSQNER